MSDLIAMQYHGLSMAQTIVWFFIYAFIGWVMECIVIRREKGIWENRGFAKLPFCIIYPFGAIAVYELLSPIADNIVALYISGAIIATTIEYITAKVMLMLFGEFWWDYKNKFMNYQGIICLESTVGWGLLTVFFFKFMNRYVTIGVSRIPRRIANTIAITLLVAYILDFTTQFLHSLSKEKECN
ncbi:MAG: putative ABC transporter permease [Lachnospiraceae bacterium]|nr:putative ABC transporter permease [Lachnospiraceae bacterium]